MQDEQIVISAVIQNGVFTHLAASNATATCVAFGTATMADGGEIRVDVGPGESAAVPIPAELGGVEVFRFKGDIPGERKGGFGLTFTSFTGFGGGAAC